MSDKDFKVFSYSILDDEKMYHHFLKGIVLYIRKGNAEVILNEKEVRELFRSLPSPIGFNFQKNV